ncbi:MAG: CBS domain-containing protein [Planctomycetota bacterium]|nr:CBS domain-containing protein [Planctomycetota bacterium]
MGTARSLISLKKGALATLPPDASVLQAARLMNKRHIGSVLVVLDEALVGIFTERDVMRRVVAKGRDPDSTCLVEVMTSPVACASPETMCSEMRKVMRDKCIRHVPVVDDQQVLLGMISIGDLNRNEIDVQVETIRYLEQYMSVQ